MVITAPFLVIIISIFVFIENALNISLGPLFFRFLCWLLVSYISHSIVQGIVIFGRKLNLNDSLCSFLGFSIYFSFMTSYIWLLAVCFDVWISFE